MLKLFTSLAVLAGTTISFFVAAQEIPTFTPNVVDSARILSSSEIKSINDSIQRIRQEKDVLSAVFIVSRLENSTIEDLAVRAFQKWALGEKGKDNGVLLVIAIQDRKSRIEVGYGLEESLTDARTQRVLTGSFREHMRKGRHQEAILAALNEISEYARTPAEDPGAQKAKLDHLHGRLLYGFYLFVLWLLVPLLRYRIRAVERAAQKIKPGYQPGSPDMSLMFIFRILRRGPTPLCLTQDTRVLGSFHRTRLRGIGQKIRKAWLNWLENYRAIHQDCLRKGLVVETSFGNFDPTDAYFKSSDHKELAAVLSRSNSSSGSRRGSSGSSSSSNSGSSSSSSGGGSSGGGGSSSSW